MKTILVKTFDGPYLGRDVYFRLLGSLITEEGWDAKADESYNDTIASLYIAFNDEEDANMCLLKYEEGEIFSAVKAAYFLEIMTLGELANE